MPPTILTNKINNNSFPIVGIGASAGGVEAITELFKHLPSNTGMGFIYIQHLDPVFPSKLSEIISRFTSMPVAEAIHSTSIQPDHIYIIPPNKDITIVNDIIQLNERKMNGSHHLPIDLFFSSLSERENGAFMAIVLSGTGSDGTLGLRAVKTAGGVTFAQDETAQFQSMPKSAISDGAVDMILSPDQIADELKRLSEKKDILIQASGNATDDLINDGDEELKNILQLLKKSAGIDFTHYKINTIKRRIIRRMLLYKLDSLKEYVQYLKQHVNEINILYQDLLINVTTFFRDPDTMEFLKKSIAPKIVKSKQANDPIRIWIPACSTGEEAYSIAMTFIEVLGEKATNTSIQIFATDLSEVTITKARLGLYTRNDVANVSPKRLQRFFTKVDGSYRIVKAIRDLCVFAPHNLFKDPPFSRIDLISCCNLMIYVDSVLQKKILATFHYSLNHDGFLILGKSETIGTSSQLFSQLEKRFKVYVKNKDTSTRAMFEMNYRIPEYEKSSFHPPKKGYKVAESGLDIEKMVDNILLEKYIPASVVVNQELEILQFRGSTGFYLEPAPGKASLNLLKMAKPGLGFELRNTIHKATKSGESVKKTGLDIKINNVSHLVNIEAVPLRSDTEDKYFLVLFEHFLLPEHVAIKSSISKDKIVKKLEDELKMVKEDMRSIIEEQEASNEELQSANEEIVSSNEELQSINEELETSKEELESTNEELMTINAELQMRNEELAEAHEYAEAVFDTLREGLLILDKDFIVRSANNSFYKMFQTSEEDIEGMVIFELANRKWDIPQIRNLIQEYLYRNSQYQGLEITHDFTGTGEKSFIINACKVIQKIHQQQLILLAFEDVTDFKK